MNCAELYSEIWKVDRTQEQQQMLTALTLEQKRLLDSLCAPDRNLAELER